MKNVWLVILVLGYAAVAFVGADGARWDNEHFSVGERSLFALAFGVLAGMLLGVTSRVDNKLLGIAIFLLILHASILWNTNPARWESNHFNLGQRIGMAGVLCLGAGLLIVTGGVDLSIGSVVGLCACAFCWTTLKLHAKLTDAYPEEADQAFVSTIALSAAALVSLAIGALVGFANGILVTYVRVQAFVVTLCGLFLYRGAAKWISDGEVPRIARHVQGLNAFFTGEFLGVSIFLWLLLILFVLSTIFLHLTIYGRYFFALGSNERAARYSGINTDWFKILAYVLCSSFAAIYSLIYVAKDISVVPSDAGSMLELYAIAGAVIGGCSLRGGEGTTIGIVIGASILVLLPNFTNMLGIRSELELSVIGGALLACAIMDEVLRRGLTWHDVKIHLQQHWVRYLIASILLGAAVWPARWLYDWWKA